MKKSIEADWSTVLTRESEPFKYNGLTLGFYVGKKQKRKFKKKYAALLGGLPLGKKQRRKLRKQQREENKPKKQQNSFKDYYDRYILSGTWRQRKNKFYADFGKVCMACGDQKRVTLHHMSYEHMKEELDHELIALCWNCHKEYHRKNGTQKDMIFKTLYFVNLRRKERGLSEYDNTNPLKPS